MGGKGLADEGESTVHVTLREAIRDEFNCDLNICMDCFFMKI